MTEQLVAIEGERREAILAVDDNPINLLALEGMLVPRYELLQARSGAQALAMVREQAVDLILLDIAMPEMDGYEVCRRLKQDAATAEIPVIFLTAAESRGSELAGLTLGAVDYLSKPVNMPILLARLRNHLDLRQARQDLWRANESLEVRVRKRTEALGAANAALTEEVRQHMQTEHLLEQAIDKLNAANRARDEFLSTMSHELRTPLNGILGMIDLAMMDAKEQEQIGFLDLARESAGSLHRLIERMLEFVILDAEGRSAKRGPFSIAEIVDQALRSHAAQADRKSIALQSQLAADLPEAIVGDPGLMESTLDELLANAVAFTKAGSILVHVVRDAALGSDIRFSVTDTGGGIPAEAMSTLFEAFTQVDGSSTRKHGGVGIGLALARKRVALMGGSIWAESTPGKGTTVHFTVPERPC